MHGPLRQQMFRSLGTEAGLQGWVSWKKELGVTRQGGCAARREREPAPGTAEDGGGSM